MSLRSDSGLGELGLFRSASETDELGLFRSASALDELEGSGKMSDGNNNSNEENGGIWLAEKDAGKTYRQIADKYKVSPTTVKTWVRHEIARLEKPNVDQMRVKVARKYARIEAFAEELMNTPESFDPEFEIVLQGKRVKGAELMLKAEEARRKMYGLDVAERKEIAVNHFGGMSREQLKERISVLPIQGHSKVVLNKKVDEICEIDGTDG